MNHYFSKVYEIVAKIPEGKVATYGQIAAMPGSPRNARVVGWAMRAAPGSLNLPCHRVIDREGNMAPGYAFGGAEIQRDLLEQEGVPFKPDGRVDLKRCLWADEG